LREAERESARGKKKGFEEKKTRRAKRGYKIKGLELK